MVDEEMGRDMTRAKILFVEYQPNPQVDWTREIRKIASSRPLR